MTYKLILTDAYYFFTGNLRRIFTLCVPFLLAGEVVNQIIINSGDGDVFSPNRFLMSLAVNMALYPIYTGALIQMMARQAHNELPSNTELISAALRTYGPLLMLSIIGWTFIMLGLLAFFVPGIWLAVRLAFSQFYLVVENLDPKTAIFKSFQATRNCFFKIFFILLISAFPVLIILVLAQIGLSSIKSNPAITALIGTAIAFLSLFIDVILFRVFMEVKQNESRGAVL